MTNWRSRAGRGTLRLLLLVAVLAVAVYVAWGFTHAPSGAPRVATSQATLDSAQRKALAFAQAQAQAQRTGRPVQVVETFDDAELSSLANQAAAARDVPVDQISLHATGQGTVQGQGQAHVAGQSVPVTLVGVPIVDGDRVALNVTSTQVGSLPLPGPLGDQVTQSIRQPLALGQPIQGFQDLRVAVTEGHVTVSGVAQPA